MDNVTEEGVEAEARGWLRGDRFYPLPHCDIHPCADVTFVA
jgi:hypothetical protein